MFAEPKDDEEGTTDEELGGLDEEDGATDEELGGLDEEDGATDEELGGLDEEDGATELELGVELLLKPPTPPTTATLRVGGGKSISLAI